MKEFDLKEYLANPERKVVTRCGKEVEIISTKGSERFPIIGYVENNQLPASWCGDGRFIKDKEKINPFDLFFADEESEDERIGKELVALFKERLRESPDAYWHGLKVANILNWLEKQKEQKPAHTAKERWKEMRLEVYAQASGNRHEPNYSDDSTKMFSLCDIDEIFEKIGNSVVQQKPVEWSEEYREEDVQTRFAFYTYKDEPSVLYLSNVFVEEASRNHGFGTRILIAAEKAAEVIGATTICLKVKQDSPANVWYRKNGYGYMTFEDGYDWLQKNLEYMKPTKQEWSEEDERILNVAIRSCEQTIEDYPNDKVRFNDCIAWLKSLHPKPEQDILPSLSDKQIICLKRTLDYLRKEHNRYGGEDFTNEIVVLEWLITHPILISEPHWKPSEEQPEVDLEKLGGIARHLIAVKDHEEDMRLDEGEWTLLERIGYPERFNARK